MNKKLAALTTMPTYEQLVEAYEVWIESSDNEKKEFFEFRENLVNQFSGCFYDDAQECHSSGSANGMVRKYRWGPNFWDFWRFHTHLCFEDINYDKVFYLNHSVVTGLNFSEESFYGKGTKTVIRSDDPNRDAEKITDYIYSKTKKTPIFWFMGTQAEVLIKKGGDLFQKLNEKGSPVFHTTGDICPKTVKEYFKDKDLRDTMRVWNGGATFITCQYGNTHWIDFLATTYVKDGILHSTDHFNLAQHFRDYPTGDRISVIKKSICKCGRFTCKNFWQEKESAIRIDNEMVTYDGLRKAFYAHTPVKDIQRIIGLNFGVARDLFGGKKRVAVLYETSDGKPINTEKERFGKETNSKAVVVMGLSYGRYKSRKLFLMNTEDIKEVNLKLNRM